MPHYIVFVVLCRSSFDDEHNVDLHEAFRTLEDAKKYCDLDAVFPSSEWKPTALRDNSTPFLWTREYTNPNFPNDKTIHEIWRMKIINSVDEVIEETLPEEPHG